MILERGYVHVRELGRCVVDPDESGSKGPKTERPANREKNTESFIIAT